MTFDLDLEHTLDARLPGDHRVQVWSRSGHLSARRSDLRKSLQTDRQTDRRTDDGRLAIALAHSWNELKIAHKNSNEEDVWPRWPPRYAAVPAISRLPSSIVSYRHLTVWPVSLLDDVVILAKSGVCAAADRRLATFVCWLLDLDLGHSDHNIRPISIVTGVFNTFKSCSRHFFLFDLCN